MNVAWIRRISGNGAKLTRVIICSVLYLVRAGAMLTLVYVHNANAAAGTHDTGHALVKQQIAAASDEKKNAAASVGVRKPAIPSAISSAPISTSGRKFSSW